MVVVAQLVRALVCGTRGRRFEPGLPPKKSLHENEGSFLFYNFLLYLFRRKYLRENIPYNHCK